MGHKPLFILQIKVLPHILMYLYRLLRGLPAEPLAVVPLLLYYWVPCCAIGVTYGGYGKRHANLQSIAIENVSERYKNYFAKKIKKFLPFSLASLEYES